MIQLQHFVNEEVELHYNACKLIEPKEVVLYPGVVQSFALMDGNHVHVKGYYIEAIYDQLSFEEHSTVSFPLKVYYALNWF